MLQSNEWLRVMHQHKDMGEVCLLDCQWPAAVLMRGGFYISPSGSSSTVFESYERWEEPAHAVYILVKVEDDKTKWHPSQTLTSPFIPSQATPNIHEGYVTRITVNVSGLLCMTDIPLKTAPTSQSNPCKVVRSNTLKQPNPWKTQPMQHTVTVWVCNGWGCARVCGGEQPMTRLSLTLCGETTNTATYNRDSLMGWLVRRQPCCCAE